MRQKLITLCPNSFEIALKKPNFSAWVRMKLLEYDEEVLTEGPLFKYKCPVCHKLKDFSNQDMAWRCNLCNVPLDFVSVIL